MDPLFGSFVLVRVPYECSLFTLSETWERDIHIIYSFIYMQIWNDLWFQHTWARNEKLRIKTSCFVRGVRLVAILSQEFISTEMGISLGIFGILCLKVSRFHHGHMPGADWWTEAGNQRSLWSLRYWWLRLESGPGFWERQPDVGKSDVSIRVHELFDADESSNWLRRHNGFSYSMIIKTTPNWTGLLFICAHCYPVAKGPQAIGYL